MQIPGTPSEQVPTQAGTSNSIDSGNSNMEDGLADDVPVDDEDELLFPEFVVKK